MPVSITSIIAWHTPGPSRPEPLSTTLGRILRWQQKRNHPANARTANPPANASSRQCAADRKEPSSPALEAKAARSPVASRRLLSDCRKRERKELRCRENPLEGKENKILGSR